MNTIPNGPVPPSRVNPQCLLLYGPPKVGKTSACAALPNSLLLELEPGGADFVSARKVDIPDMDGLLAILKDLTERRKAGQPAARRLVVDTIDVVDWWADRLALSRYKATPLGKDFPGTSIIELPMGAGYFRLREEMGSMLWLFSQAAEEVILLAHVRDKFLDKSSGMVAAQDIDLTGKVRNIVCSRCSGIGLLRRDYQDKLYACFKTSETVNCSSRCPHLSGQEILLGERANGGLAFHWDSIYLPDTPSANGSVASPGGGTVAGTVGALL